jgi:hypothetical protein
VAKQTGLVFMLYMNAIIGNFAAGSFASIILPYAAKRNQKKDKHSEYWKINHSLRHNLKAGVLLHQNLYEGSCFI